MISGTISESMSWVYPYSSSISIISGTISESLSYNPTYNFDDTNSLKFEVRENKKTNLTEYYNLIYQYRNDCLIAAIEYNKDYYSVGDLKPEENLFFKLTIIPFGEASSPSLKK